LKNEKRTSSYFVPNSHFLSPTFLNMTQRLASIICHYKQWKNQNPDTWIEHCKNQSTLSEAIHIAGLSENYLGKRHPHQYRLKKFDLENFTAKLLDKENQLNKVLDFDTLLKGVSEAKSKGIGQLTIYDTAQRLGEYLNIFPNKIYLHAGTKTGVKKLIGKTNKNSITKDILPEPFKTADLTCSELEDILCIYKQFF